MGAQAAAHRAQVSPEVERLRFASFANVVVVGAVERLGPYYYLVQPSTADPARRLSSVICRARDLALAVLTPSGLDASAYHPVARLGVHVSDEVSTCSPTATL